MDKFFVDETESHRVDLEDGQWIEVKAEMSIGDWDRLEKELIQVQWSGQPADGLGAQGTLHRSEVMMLEINILRWSFSREVNRTNIAKLKRPIADRVIEEVDKLNLSPKEQRAARQVAKRLGSTQP